MTKTDIGLGATCVIIAIFLLGYTLGCYLSEMEKKQQKLSMLSFTGYAVSYQLYGTKDDPIPQGRIQIDEVNNGVWTNRVTHLIKDGIKLRPMLTDDPAKMLLLVPVEQTIVGKYWGVQSTEKDQTKCVKTWGK